MELLNSLDYSHLKVGVIGCGKMGERHVNAYRQLGVHDIVVFDIDRSLANQLGKRYECSTAESLEAVFGDDHIQAVNICTPTPTHANLTVRGLDAGKYVFCEKPLCLTLDEAYEVKQAEMRNPGQVMVGYIYRFFPQMRFVKQILTDNVIGTPYMAILRLGGRGSQAVWKHLRSAGGGALLEMTVHNLDLVTWLLGTPSLVECYRQDTLLPDRDIAGQTVRVDAEDFVLVRLDANGVEIICQADLVTPSFMHYLEIQGDNGSIFSSILDLMPTTVFVQNPRGGLQSGQHQRTFERSNAHQAELGHFLNVVLGRAEIMSSVNDTIAVTRVLEAIRSAHDH